MINWWIFRWARERAARARVSPRSFERGPRRRNASERCVFASKGHPERTTPTHRIRPSSIARAIPDSPDAPDARVLVAVTWLSFCFFSLICRLHDFYLSSVLKTVNCGLFVDKYASVGGGCLNCCRCGLWPDAGAHGGGRRTRNRSEFLTFLATPLNVWFIDAAVTAEILHVIHQLR